MGRHRGPDSGQLKPSQKTCLLTFVALDITERNKHRSRWGETCARVKQYAIDIAYGRPVLKNEADACDGANSANGDRKTDFDYYPRDVAKLYHDMQVIRSGQPLINHESRLSTLRTGMDSDSHTADSRKVIGWWCGRNISIMTGTAGLPDPILR
jgi:hypothetical protein